VCKKGGRASYYCHNNVICHALSNTCQHLTIMNSSDRYGGSASLYIQLTFIRSSSYIRVRIPTMAYNGVIDFEYAQTIARLNRMLNDVV
jgi:hypothetical protein